MTAPTGDFVVRRSSFVSRETSSDAAARASLRLKRIRLILILKSVFAHSAKRSNHTDIMKALMETLILRRSDAADARSFKEACRLIKARLILVIIPETCGK